MSAIKTAPVDCVVFHDDVVVERRGVPFDDLDLVTDAYLQKIVVQLGETKQLFNQMFSSDFQAWV